MEILTCYYCGETFESDFSHDEVLESVEEIYPDDIIEVRDICLDCFEANPETKH